MAEMLKKLKKRVFDANILLPAYGLVMFTWGNASEVDESRRYMVIKPSGVRYGDMTWEMMCVMDIETGLVAEGGLNPSTDAPTHLELYKNFPDVCGIVHTHSTFATAFAQAGLGIPCYGTTHADYFYGEVPCTRQLTAEEINGDYERNTGRVIAETFIQRADAPLAVPGVLVGGHGPFALGASAKEAAANAAYLEEIARLAYITKQLSGGAAAPAPAELLDKHYFRKHGADSYYGQK